MGRHKNIETIDENSSKNKLDPSQVVLSKILEDKTLHFNHIIPKTYRISTGSLNLDLETGGGLNPSIIRCAGPAEGGKTSFSLNIIKNFLTSINNSKGLYFLSDKELSEELRIRSGVKFVEDENEWVDGTCFILRTNIYETVCNTIKRLVETKTNTNFVFVLDSMDNFAPKSALECDFGESFIKGGIGAITSHFFKHFNILLPRLGHLTIMISQYRDTVVIGKQAAYIPPKQMSTSGGRSQEHAVTWAFEFKQALSTENDMYWEGERNQSKKLGHNCIIQLKKSPNEKTFTTVRYPIVYGRGPGKSVWIEREILDQLLIWSMVKRNGGWLSWEPSILQEVEKLDTSVSKQIQGQDNFVKYLESKPDITKYLYDKIRTTITGI